MVNIWLMMANDILLGGYRYKAFQKIDGTTKKQHG